MRRWGLALRLWFERRAQERKERRRKESIWRQIAEIDIRNAWGIVHAQQRELEQLRKERDAAREALARWQDAQPETGL